MSCRAGALQSFDLHLGNHFLLSWNEHVEGSKNMGSNYDRRARTLRTSRIPHVQVAAGFLFSFPIIILPTTLSPPRLYLSFSLSRRSSNTVFVGNYVCVFASPFNCSSSNLLTSLSTSELPPQPCFKPFRILFKERHEFGANCQIGTTN